MTYFEGHEELGIPADIESKRLWGQFLPSERIIPGNMKVPTNMILLSFSPFIFSEDNPLEC